jgi:hypothetical protein
MAPKRQSTSKALTAGKPSKKAKQQLDERQQDDFFLDSDNDQRSEDEGGDGDAETAEEKRLRLGGRARCGPVAAMGPPRDPGRQRRSACPRQSARSCY